MKNKLITPLLVALALAELLLVFLSWILSVTTTADIHSLLSGEGLRWYLGRLNDIMLSPVLVWILLLSVSAGCLHKSRVLSHHRSYWEKLAFRMSLFVLLLYCALLVLLAAMPHAVLLSATGQLLPSPFIHAIVPLLSFGLLVVSVCYGLITRTFASVSDIIEAACYGLAKSAPLLLIYLLAVQLYASLRFVF